MDSVFPILGIALIAAALLQFALWSGRSLQLGILDRRKFESELELLRARIDEIAEQRKASRSQLAETQPAEPVGASAIPDPEAGFRTWQVIRREQETENAVSICFRPADPLPLPPFRPGQHVTLRISLPGHRQPVIRCYTLSDAPGLDHYRITIKLARPPADQPACPAGVVSNHIHQNLSVGDTLSIKPPSGKFYLQPGEQPIVLLAGGIGITPMISMINHLVASGSQRRCLLVYGVRNGADLTFGEHLVTVARQHPNLQVIRCFTAPRSSDRPNIDYQVQGPVSMDVLRAVLPSNQFDFYLCGPPAFMESLYRGLVHWGVPETQIRFEAFGPATVRRKQRLTGPESPAGSSTVTLARSAKTLLWSGDHETLLDFCAAHDVAIDSGCRAGCCGTCATRLVNGTVRYLDEVAECPDGCVLPCIAVPDGPVEIDV